MSTFEAVSAVLAVAAITYASRAGLIVMLADRTLAPELTRALRYVGPAVLSALTASLVAGGEGIGGVEVAEILSIGACIVVAAITRSLVAALVAGMAALWLVLWLA